MPLESWEKTEMRSRWLEHQHDPAAFLDTILEMTARALNVPAAMISALFPDRQEVRALHGRFGELTAPCAIPLSHSICKHVVGMGRPLIVRDALAHPLVKDNRGVRENGIAAYIGEPLHDRHGRPVGSFCVMDRNANDWTDAQLRMMSINAMLIERALNWPDGAHEFPAV